MNTQELSQKYQAKYFEDNDLFTLKGIHAVNYDPHPYMLGPAHITYANKHSGGVIDEGTLKNVRWSPPKCNIPYEDHKFDTGMFLQLKRNGTNEEAGAFMNTMLDEMKEDNIAGFTFVETEEKYRLDEESES